MKVALVCIAKNEDNYIKEWIEYHLKLGFNQIFIYENDWRCSLEHPNLTKIPFDGKSQQSNAYNNFINQNHQNYQWAAFFDVDEFLVLKKHKNIVDLLIEYENYNGLGINWVFFGSNGLEKVEGDYSVIKRFTKREIKINHHVKTILKLNKGITMSIHSPDSSIVDTNKKSFSGSFNPKGDDNIAQLNHYFTKTKEEFILKVSRGRADNGTVRDLTDFNYHDVYEIEDLNAYNFFYDNHNIFNT